MLKSKSIILPFKTIKDIIIGFNKNLKKRRVIPKQYVKKALGYKPEIINLYSFIRLVMKRRLKNIKAFLKI
jgi:hypothetical protein